jgi:hypothetical protein
MRFYVDHVVASAIDHREHDRRQAGVDLAQPARAVVRDQRRAARLRTRDQLLARVQQLAVHARALRTGVRFEARVRVGLRLRRQRSCEQQPAHEQRRDHP